MTRSRSLLCALAAMLGIISAIAADSSNWVGEYATKNFLNGQAVFQMSIEQSGKAIQIAFDAGYNDGHGAAPDATGQGRITDKGTIEFRWEDSFNNSGTGTIAHAGDGIIASLKMSHVVEPRCLALYGQNIRLKRVGKK